MAKAGGTIGNTNSSQSNRLWGDTIRKAIAQGKPDRLRKIAESLLDKAAEGDMAAMRELGDRLDGKPAQAIVGADGDTLKLIHKIEVEIVHPKD